MPSMNKAIIIGHLGKNPEVRTFQNGGRIASFSIATTEKWRDKKSGENREKTEWHNIKVTNDKTIDLVDDYVSKGDAIYVEGQLETRKWTDKLGNDKYTTEVVVKPYTGQIVLLGGKKGSGAPKGDAVDSLNDDIPPF